MRIHASHYLLLRNKFHWHLNQSTRRVFCWEKSFEYVVISTCNVLLINCLFALIYFMIKTKRGCEKDFIQSEPAFPSPWSCILALSNPVPPFLTFCVPYQSVNRHRVPFTWIDFNEVITSIIKCGMKLLIHSQTSNRWSLDMGMEFHPILNWTWD